MAPNMPKSMPTRTSNLILSNDKNLKIIVRPKSLVNIKNRQKRRNVNKELNIQTFILKFNLQLIFFTK